MYSPRKETSLSETQEDSHNQQPRISRNSSRANSNNSPRNHNSSNPFTRRKVLEEDITREFHEDIWDEEQGYCDVVSLACEVKLGDDVVFWCVVVQRAGIAQVDSVEVV